MSGFNNPRQERFRDLNELHVKVLRGSTTAIQTNNITKPYGEVYVTTFPKAIVYEDEWTSSNRSQSDNSGCYSILQTNNGHEIYGICYESVYYM